VLDESAGETAQGGLGGEDMPERGLEGIGLKCVWIMPSGGGLVKPRYILWLSGARGAEDAHVLMRRSSAWTTSIGTPAIFTDTPTRECPAGARARVR
jgi:hypothetical protein